MAIPDPKALPRHVGRAEGQATDEKPTGMLEDGTTVAAEAVQTA